MSDRIQHIVVPAHLSSLQKSVDFVSSLTRKQGFDAKRLSEIELCVEEILVNIFHYAYPDKQGEVEIFCQADPEGAFTIKIVDSGIPFDILSSDDPDISVNIDERQIGGLGIYFVKKLMDRVEYHRENNKNILCLINMTTAVSRPVNE